MKRNTPLLTLLVAGAFACTGGPALEDEISEAESPLSIGGVLDVVLETSTGLHGCYRCSLAAADFDGDGYKDLVVAGAFDSAFTANMASYTDANVVRVYRNLASTTGRIRFAQQLEVSGVRGAGGALIVAGDFDGNGRQDFAVQFRDGTAPFSDTSAFMNQGSWSFTRRVLVAGFDTDRTSLGMVAADVDRDNKMDLVFASDGNGVAPGLWYKYNTASNTWTAMQTSFSHRLTYGGALAAGDLDGDGYSDLIAGGSGPLAFGAFNCASTTLYGEIHFNLARAGSSAGFGTAGVSLAPFAVRASASTSPCSGMVNAGIAVADVDLDGRNDLILAGSAEAFRGPAGANESMYDFAVLKNLGNGRSFTTFENAGTSYSGGATSGGAGSTDFPNIAVGDMSGDGLPDVFIQGARPDYSNSSGNYVFDTRFYVNAGAGRFTELETGFTNVSEGGQVMADFNNDGTSDLIFAGATRAFHPNGANTADTNNASSLVARVYRNIRRPSGAPAPRPPPAVDAGFAPDSGTPDSGTPDSGTTPPPPPGGCSGSPLTGGGTSGPVNILAESGHGLPGCYRCGMDRADFDGDGRIDVVMAGAFDAAYTPGMGNYTYQNVVRLYRNVSCPGQQIRFVLQQEVSGAVGGGGAIAVAGDYNGDGRKDFAVQFREGDAPDSDTSAFMNNGNWSFTRRRLVSGFDTNSTSMGMAAADIDRDGLDDLIFNSDGYGSGPGLWYRWSTSSGAWVAQQTDFSHHISYGGTIAAGDLNGDSYPDIVVGGNSNQPFGTYNCASTLMYGQIHMNKGAVTPRGIQPASANSLGRFALRNNRATNSASCTGSDNASMLIYDVDADGHQDVILAGSSDGFAGPVGMNASHYDFVVLRNVDGTGANFVTFENAGTQYPNGTTNGGTGNLDFPNIAAGDLTGDGRAEVFIQGHHRDYAGDVGSYVFDSRFFLNAGGTSFTELDLGLPDVGEGGQVMADFNNDGKIDLIFTGASIPFHSNGNNPTDYNNASTLFTHVYRNTR